METSIQTPQSIFFKIVRYDVPVFQRPYIWTQDDQWEPLWEDASGIAGVLLEGNDVNRHFMGAIVLQQHSTSVRGIETLTVVDGQQRLTTLQLLLDAVQEVYEQNGHEDPAVRLKPLVQNPEAYLGSEADLAFKIWPTIYDQPAFRHAMHNELSGDEYKSSRIVAAHNYFKNKTEQWLLAFAEATGDRDQAAEALERAVRDYLELVVIELRQTDDPHIIFETLNARGTPLLPSDMIKNQILHKAGIGATSLENSVAEEANRLWPFSGDWWRKEIGRGHQRRPRVDVYLNNWLTLRNLSETKAHDEFATFTRYVEQADEGGTTIQAIAEDIGRLGEVYRSIDQLGLPEIEPFLYRRSIMGVGVLMPLLLWLLSSGVSPGQLRKSVKALDSYLVRRMACGLPTRSYGQLFVRLISELHRSGSENAGRTVVDYLSRQTAHATRWPDDQSLLETFISAPLYWSLTAGRLNLILQGLESELRTAWSESQIVPRNLHIEHVLPQGWQVDQWPLPPDVSYRDEALAKRERLIHSIGNLTLVTQRLNSSLSNAPWREKKETLDKHTVLALNKDLLAAAPPVWDESAIVDRGERLGRLAVRVWPHATSFEAEE